jgi:hypothetical protein
MTTQRIPSFLVLGERQGKKISKVIFYPDKIKVLQDGKLRDFKATDRVGGVLHTIPEHNISYHELLNG